jgi:hypothetical protein
MPWDGGIGITAAVAIGSKSIERLTFTSCHNAIYDKKSEKSLKAAERFEWIPKDNVDHFEADEYNLWHCKCIDS